MVDLRSNPSPEPEPFVVPAVPAPKPKDPESAFGSAEPAAHAPTLLTPDLDPPGADKLGLTPEEITQFRELGYVVKRGLIPKATFTPFLDLWWQQPPVTAAGIRPGEPGTWVAPGRHWPEENRWGLGPNWMGNSPWPAVPAPPGDGNTSIRPGAGPDERVGRLPHKLTRDMANDVWRWHGIGHDPEFVCATSAHPNVLRMAELLMGGPVKRPRRNRGVYSVFPRGPDDPESRLGPHMDQSMTEMTVVTYIDDVPARSGGFTVFPSSPQQLYVTSEQAYNWVATAASNEAMDRIKREVTPLEFVGHAGDVIFCHGLMVHSAGIHEGDTVRRAVIQDFNRVRRRSHMRWTAAGKNGGARVHCNMDGVFFIEDPLDDPEDGLREVTNQWIMDCNEFTEARDAPFEDMFANWNLGQHPATGNVVNEPAWWEKYNLPMLPTLGVPRGGGGTPAVPLNQIAAYEGGGIWRITSRANLWLK